MAKWLDDKDRRPGEDGELEDRGWEDRHPEVEAAEFEAEQPAQPYRASFLAVTLA
jgi:hypothetical protein